MSLVEPVEAVGQCAKEAGKQRWKSVGTVGTQPCYFFHLAVLLFWLCTGKLAKSTLLCY